MNQNGFQTKTLTQAPYHLLKRVNYNLGLVLGVDEFNQEQTYLMARDSLHQRLLHGYGTVAGLQVTIDTSDMTAPQILVAAGQAVNPRGDTICVPQTQCAWLNDWLNTHFAELELPDGSVPDPVILYLVLCYRECDTDNVPVPGSPCRSEGDSIVASRTMNSFELALRTSPPAQLEEENIREFGQLLEQIEITDDPGPFLSEADMIALVRGLGSDASPMGSPMSDTLRLHPADACALLETAARIWVTEVRPRILAQTMQASSGDFCRDQPDEECVLLAQLIFRVNPDWQLLGDVRIEERDRPFLLPTRFLQEWLLCHRFAREDDTETRTFATLFAPDATTIRAWLHHPEELSVPDVAVGVAVNGTAVNPIILTQQPNSNIYDITLPTALDDEDRVSVSFDADQITISGLPALPLLDSIDDLDFDYLDRNGARLRAYLTYDEMALGELSNVDTSTAINGDFLSYDGTTWRAVADPGGGVSDHGALTGLGADDHPQYFDENRGDARYALDNHTHTHNHNLNDLGNVQANPIDTGQPLIWNAPVGQWQAGTVPAQLEFPRLLHLATINRIDDRIYEVWFHFDFPANSIAVRSLNPGQVVVRRETANPNFLTSINILNIQQMQRNVFNFTLQAESDLLRFIFSMENILLEDGRSLAAYVQDENIQFIGEETRRSVTEFVRVLR